MHIYKYKNAFFIMVLETAPFADNKWLHFAPLNIKQPFSQCGMCMSIEADTINRHRILGSTMQIGFNYLQ